MKFLHLADLHLGKTVNGFSLLEDQQYILEQILQLVKTHRPQAVLLAGDIYDRTVPSAEAVELFDFFLTALSRSGTQVLLISGNHDSPERLGFAGKILQAGGVHVCGSFSGVLQSLCLSDAWGDVHFFLLPFVRPAAVRRFFKEEEIDSYTAAVRAALATAPPPKEQRSVLLAHQFVTAGGTAQRSDSETEPVGGINNIDSALFDAFDYVALGHLHGPQQMGRAAVRYAGSPLKYSFSECHQKKSATLVQMGPKGQVDIQLLPLIPLRDMRKISGPLAALTSADIAGSPGNDDYLHVTLTDEEYLLDALDKLRRVYPNVMELHFDNARSRTPATPANLPELQHKTPQQLFEEFYLQQNGSPPSKAQAHIITQLLEKRGEL